MLRYECGEDVLTRTLQNLFCCGSGTRLGSEVGLGSGDGHGKKTTFNIDINMTEVGSAVQTQNQLIAAQLDSTEPNSTETEKKA